jgi:hypothetical protein
MARSSSWPRKDQSRAQALADELLAPACSRANGDGRDLCRPIRSRVPVGSSLSRCGGDRRRLRATLPRLPPFAPSRACHVNGARRRRFKSRSVLLETRDARVPISRPLTASDQLRGLPGSCPTRNGRVDTALPAIPLPRADLACCRVSVGVPTEPDPRTASRPPAST